MGLPETWEEKQAELSFSHPTLTLPQPCSREVCLPFEVQHLWLRQGHRWSPVESAWEAQSWAVVPLCSGHPDRLLLLLGAEVLLLPFSQFDYWEAAKAGCPALLPLSGWPRCPSGQWVRTSPVTLHGPSQSRSKMSTRSTQPITVALMVLGAAFSVNHAPWGGENMEKDFVKSPAWNSITSFFNKCVTLPEKLLVFSSQTRLIFL